MLRPVTSRKLYNFLIDPELADALKALKARDGVSESETTRRALREYLQRKGIIKTERPRAVTRKRS
jgi:hypothetical protein